MKTCFTCCIKKPLFLFHLNAMKYQVKSNQGKSIECRLCTVKRFIRQKGHIIKFNFTTKKFELLHFKVNLLNIIKTYL